MARSTTHQPITQSTSDLVIGLMRVRVTSASDDDTSTCTSANDIGALQGATLSFSTTYKPHTAGYPQKEDLKTFETKDISFQVSPEEVGGSIVTGWIDSAITSLNTGNLTYYGVEGVIQKATGDYIQIWSNHCSLKPEITISTDNDWGAIEFSFDWEIDSSYTHNLPFYASGSPAPTARDRELMPITNDVNDLVIGRPQIRIGNLTANAETSSASTTSTLTSADSIGAIQGATLSFAPTFKEHMSGYPEVKDLTLLESASVSLECQPEEFSFTLSGGIVSETASTLFDVLLDSIVNNNLYYCSVHSVFELSTGDTLEFWMPNCLIEANAEITTQDDWSSFPITFTAIEQKTVSTNLIYRVAP